MKIKPIYVILAILISLYFICKRRIDINLMLLFVDINSLFGLYWRLVPEYCSPMKNGFNPVMPLEYYADFNKAIYPRIPSGDNNLNTEKIKQICERNLLWLRKNSNQNPDPIKIDIIYVDDPKFKQKALQYVKNDYPFVMRGVRLRCFTTMRFNKLLETAGNNKVYMSPSSEESCPDNIFTELKNIKQNKCYITNSTNLFYYYDDLLPDSDMEIIKQIIDGYMSNDSKQMFVGVVKGTGTALHAAYTNNFYIMIEGQKKWTFFNPNHLALLYPNFQKKGIYMASESRFLNMDTEKERLEKEFPLITYAPRYEVDLEEGDILYNPKSWFHSVYNKTDISVACSTRWSNFVNGIPDRHMLRYGNMSNPHLRDYVKDIYISTGVLGISQIDEHKHMIGEKDPDVIPYWDKYTNDSHKLCKDINCSVNWH
jgi:Cupin-like domain